MKKEIALIFSLILLFTGQVFSQTPDVKGSKDHPLLTRMPDFYISGYKDTEFDSHKFMGGDKKLVIIEGHKYYFHGGKNPYKRYCSC
jgi:hypothetical protein